MPDRTEGRNGDHACARGHRHLSPHGSGASRAFANGRGEAHKAFFLFRKGNGFPGWAIIMQPFVTMANSLKLAVVVLV